MSTSLNFEKSQADKLGIIASTLCLIHCMVTPFLFIAKACTATCCSSTPYWWKMIDYLFLVISFIAIYYAVKKSTKQWLKFALWLSWGILLLTILNESLLVISLPESFIYFPALSIVALHLYNYRYCRCAEDKCCTK